MAATKVKKQNTGQGAGNGAGSFRSRLPDYSDVDDQSAPQGPSGYVFVLILFVIVFAMLLPLIGMMYVDTMVTKREAKAQMEKVEKLRKQIEEERKNANPILKPNIIPDGRSPQNP